MPSPPRWTWSLASTVTLLVVLVGVAHIDRELPTGEIDPSPDEVVPDNGIIDPATPIPDAPAALVIEASGAIDAARVDGTIATITGWAVDHDDPASTSVRVRVDGEPAAHVRSDLMRPDVGSVTGDDMVGFEATVELAPGARRICVSTLPDDDLVACTRVATEDHVGVLRTPTGVMTRIIDVRRGGAHVVRTPCGKRAVVRGGTRLRTTQILLDPGHGGYEVASVGPNGLSEKHLNLDVAVRTAELLRERGFSVELTRTTDMTLPIQIRAELANALDPDLFLSIHHNGGATARTPVPGTQAYYQHDDPEARRAAGILYEELFAAASEYPTAWVGNSKDGVSTRLDAEGDDFYGIHRRTPDVTSVITEFLWVSNGPEAELLNRDEVRQAEAMALADGVERWYRTAHRGSGFIEPFVDTFDAGGGGFEGCVDPALQ